MHVNYSYILLFFFGTLFYPKVLIAQEIQGPTDDLGDVSDAFQENFFEALKQKGIENYELALEALKKAEEAAKEDPDAKAVVFFEMAKNLSKLKRYEEAEANFNKVLQARGDQLDVLEALYDLYYQQKNYEAAIPLVIKLTGIDGDYKEDLANLYSRTKQFDKSLQVLDELDELWGESDYRDALRAQIYRQTGNTSGRIAQLEGNIDANPQKEKDYLNLIYLYSEEGNNQKAFEAAKELLKNNPTSELVHLALYKFYLTDGFTEKALGSMKMVFASQEIDRTSKYKVLGDFIQFVEENPNYEGELRALVNLFADKNDGQVYEKLGDYYLSKGQNKEALVLYEKGVALGEDNYSLLKNTLLLEIEFKDYVGASKLSYAALEIFPAQALIYLLNGVANNGLQKPDLAIEALEGGIDYLLDDNKMEKAFYEQLTIAYRTKGDTQNANLFEKKALDLKDPN
ncbi:MAG: tetratricopeptide (TPR) repeat protein [Ulvibacter sp.]|jgi:tetratricopeptide (TPR) repeat protein